MLIKKKGVIFIDRTRMVFFEEGMSQPVLVEFTPNIIINLEIVDIDELTKAVTNFIQTNKLIPAQLLFVVYDDLIFAKSISRSNPDKEKHDIQLFLETVPFENISSRMIQSTSDIKISAINATFFNQLFSVFELNGFQFNLIVSYKEVIPGKKPQNGIDQHDIRLFLSRFDSLKQYGFDLHPQNQDEDTPTHQQQTSSSQKKQPNRQIILVIVFIFLVVVLLLLLVKK